MGVVMSGPSPPQAGLGARGGGRAQDYCRGVYGQRQTEIIGLNYLPRTTERLTPRRDSPIRIVSFCLNDPVEARLRASRPRQGPQTVDGLYRRSLDIHGEMQRKRRPGVRGIHDQLSIRSVNTVPRKRKHLSPKPKDIKADLCQPVRSIMLEALKLYPGHVLNVDGGNSH
jgi:hypothetical protein